MAEKKKSVKKQVKTSAVKKVSTPKKKVKKVASPKVVKETKIMNEESTFSLWIDILMLIFVLIIFGIILYSYVTSN